jgi:hypothetical protein
MKLVALCAHFKTRMNDNIRALKSFNNRVERLRSFTIPKLAKAGLLRTSAQAALGEGGRPGTRHPSQEEIDSFVNNIRFFIQDNETTSFRNLAQKYDGLPVPEDLKMEFHKLRTKLNHWLDSKSSLGLGGAPLTHRQIFETFIYGDVAHQSRKKRELFDRWRESPVGFPLFEAQFVDIIGKFSGFLAEASDINGKALAHLTE